jgi:hypothetical protein
VAILREPCWHSCPHCRKDWCHSVNSTAPPDTYFTPCASCQLREGFDAVAEFEKQCRPTRKAATEEIEDFSLMLPTTAMEEEQT